MAITLYDIPSTLPNSAWSANVWKTRYCLNYKRLEYRTIWVEYPDIESHCKRLGIAPTEKKPDGRDHYTLPAIHDQSTGVYISESFSIAQYLDRQYPDSPLIFPDNTVALQNAFVKFALISVAPVRPLAISIMAHKLNAASQPYFRETREKLFGKTIEALSPVGEAKVKQWAALQAGLGQINEVYSTSAIGPFILGETPSWADFVIGAYLKWWKLIWGEESDEWKSIITWDEGRWGELSQLLESYGHVL